MLREIVDNKIKETMKSGSKAELAVWKAIKDKLTRLRTAEVPVPITEDVEKDIILEMIAQHKDSIKQFTDAGRVDLATPEIAELNVLLELPLAPKEPTDEEIKSVINEIFEEIRISDGGEHVFSMRDMKTVQSNVKQRFPGVDGSKIADIFKKMI